MPGMKETLSVISEVADKNNLSTPYIVGGIPRDKVLGIIEEINDIDLTTGDEGSLELSKKVYEALAQYGASIKEFDDGHSQVSVSGMQIDFSSYFIDPRAEDLLKKGGLKKPTSMMLELFSRDFTCNALLMDLEFNKVNDYTGLGLTDIKRKLLRTLFPAKITLTKEKRIPRVYYMAAKLGFDVDQEIIDFIRKNKNIFNNLKPKYIEDKFREAVKYDLTKTVQLINLTEVWEYVPLIPELMEFKP